MPTQGTVAYRERVNRVFGGDKRVDDFYRLFLLPGVTHCVGGTGPFPTDDLGALVRTLGGEGPGSGHPRSLGHRPRRQDRHA